MAKFEDMGLNGLLWQDGNDDGIAEPAILLRNYNAGDIVEISQEARFVNVNTASLDVFVKALKKIATAKEPKK